MILNNGSSSRNSLLPSGERLGVFTLLKMVGRGSMGAVYTAWQEGLSRQVAVKILMKDRFDQLVTPERFLQEAETAQFPQSIKPVTWSVKQAGWVCGRVADG